MSTQITMRDLLEAGVHFGHQTSKWNPKMKPYIFGARNGIYIIDLQKTVTLAKEALSFVAQLSAKGKKVLFVGTKDQCKGVVKEEAERVGCPYVSERWLGGTLTNNQTILGCLDKINRIEEKKSSGLFDQLVKKEQSQIDKEYGRLMHNLGGIRNMKERPGAMFVVDPVREHIAVAEAKKLNIPIIAITDTNCDPDDISFVIPGNDDALKSIKLFASAIANSYKDGARIYEEKMKSISNKAPVATQSENTVSKEASSSPDAAPATTTDREGRVVNVEVRRKIKSATAVPSTETSEK